LHKGAFYVCTFLTIFQLGKFYQNISDNPLTFGLQYIIIILGFKMEVSYLPERKKLGRPTDNPKGVSMHVRLDKEAEKILDAYCIQEQVSKMEATRRGIKKLKDDLKK